MSKKPIKKLTRENVFEPAVGGASGVSNVQPGWGTFASPNVQQHPSHFGFDHKHINSKGNTRKDSLYNTAYQDRDIEQLYNRPTTPTPDEIVTGIQYELGQQNKKDLALAKSNVLMNLKRNPKYYSELRMLNITDDDMTKNMMEPPIQPLYEKRHPNDILERAKVTSNIEETKKIFSDLLKGRDQKYAVNKEISDVMKEMWKKKKARSLWRKA